MTTKTKQELEEEIKKLTAENKKFKVVATIINKHWDIFGEDFKMNDSWIDELIDCGFATIEDFDDD